MFYDRNACLLLSLSVLLGFLNCLHSSQRHSSLQPVASAGFFFGGGGVGIVHLGPTWTGSRLDKRNFIFFNYSVKITETFSFKLKIKMSFLYQHFLGTPLIATIKLCKKLRDVLMLKKLKSHQSQSTLTKIYSSFQLSTFNLKYFFYV